MRNKLFTLFLLFASIASFGQAGTTTANKSCPQRFDQTTTVNGFTLTIPNDCGGVRGTFTEIVTGSPATMSAVLNGCMRASAGVTPGCSLLNTSTATTTSTVKPVIDTVYDYFTVTPTWTGGTSVLFGISSTVTVAGGNGGGSGNGNVIGPNSSVANHLATFADGTGKIIQDGGVPLAPPFTESQITSLVADLAAKVATSQTVNGHPLSSPVVVSASDITTGILPHPQLPTLVSGDIPNNAANTSGLAGTATALASTPSNCGANVAANGVGANGNAVGCFTPGSGTVNPGVAGFPAVYPSSTAAVTASKMWYDGSQAPGADFCIKLDAALNLFYFVDMRAVTAANGFTMQCGTAINPLRNCGGNSVSHVILPNDTISVDVTVKQPKACIVEGAGRGLITTIVKPAAALHTIAETNSKFPLASGKLTWSTGSPGTVTATFPPSTTFLFNANASAASVTVAGLGTATKNLVKTVTDGISATDCTVGTGATSVLCIGTGSAWTFAPNVPDGMAAQVGCATATVAGRAPDAAFNGLWRMYSAAGSGTATPTITYRAGNAAATLPASSSGVCTVIFLATPLWLQGDEKQANNYQGIRLEHLNLDADIGLTHFGLTPIVGINPQERSLVNDLSLINWNGLALAGYGNIQNWGPLQNIESYMINSNANGNCNPTGANLDGNDGTGASTTVVRAGILPSEHVYLVDNAPKGIFFFTGTAGLGFGLPNGTNCQGSVGGGATAPTSLVAAFDVSVPSATLLQGNHSETADIGIQWGKQYSGSSNATFAGTIIDFTGSPAQNSDTTAVDISALWPLNSDFSFTTVRKNQGMTNTINNEITGHIFTDPNIAKYDFDKNGAAIYECGSFTQFPCQMDGGLKTAGNVTANGFATGTATVPSFNGWTFPPITAPGTPLAGTQNVYVDLTNLRFCDKNSSATVGCTVIAKANVAHQWFSSLAGSGVLTATQPASSDLSDGTSLVFNNAVNAATSAMTFNLSASSVANAFRAPVGAGLTAGADGVVAYDTAAKSTKIRTNNADSVAPGFASAPVGSKCVHTVGTTGQVAETAADCGTGGGATANPPGWLSYYGDGADGAVTDSASGNRSGVIYATTYTCSGTTVVTVPTGGATNLIIRATTSITIGANCSFVGTGVSPSIGDFPAGSGGGGGFGAANGAIGSSIKGYGQGGVASMTVGGSAGTSGVTGGAGNASSNNAIRSMLEVGSLGTEYLMGCSSAGGLGGSSGGAVGKGGACIIFVSPIINLASGSTCTANGANGGAGGANTGGGGGGGGGVCLLRSPALTDSGMTFSVVGGLGGVIGTGTSTAGGPGGAGWSKEINQ